MQRIFVAIRGVIGFIVLAGIVGAMVGAIHGFGIAADNEYRQQGLRRLARWVMADGAHDGMLVAIAGAAALLAILLLAWPIARLVLGSWRRALIGAMVAIPVLALYLWAAWYVNRFYLPGLLTFATLAGNLVLVVAAVALWYGAIRLIERTQLPSHLAWSHALTRPLPLLAMLIVPLAVLVAYVVARPSDKLGATAQPNVLIVVIDALRPDRLGAYGYTRNTSPNLDRLASESWLYTQAITTAPWTKPAIASLFTGLYPREHGISSADWSRRDEAGAAQVSALPAKSLTLPELLAEAGYRTAAFGENHHLIARLGFAQGFEEHALDLMDRSFLESVTGRLGLGIAHHFASPGQGRNTGRKIHERFFGWLPGGDQSYFAYLHHIDVHWPYRAPAPYAQRFHARRTTTDFNSMAFYMKAGPQRADPDQPPDIDAALLQDMSDAYDEGIQFVDAELGRLFAELKRRGSYDRTLIVVTSDHGEQFMEHGEIGHGTSLHDVLLRVPLIIKFPCPGPNCRAQRVDEQVQTVDLMPTILATVGIPAPQAVSGRDIAKPVPSTRVAYAEMGGQIALRTSQFKLIHYLEESRTELYALQPDPGERRNLADTDPQLAATFRDRLFSWLEQTEQNAAAPREEVVADEQMLARLKALGYVE